MVKQVFGALILFCCLSSSALAYKVEITEAQLQQELERVLPKTQKNKYFDVTFKSPKIDLFEHVNRMRLSVQFDINALNQPAGSGTVALSGELEYRKENCAFYIRNVSVDKLEVDKYAHPYQTQLQVVAQILLSEALASQPVYQLNDKDMREQLIMASLHSVEVADEKLAVELVY